MLQPWEKRLNTVFIIFCILLLLFACIVNIPLPFSRVYDAMEYNVADESHAVSRTVTFDGVYNVNLFSPDTFSGMITVSGYDCASGEYKMSDVQFAIKSSDLADGNISYDNPINDDARYDFLFAELYTDTFRQKFAFVLFEDGGYGTADATFIVTGMQDRAKAVKWIEYIFFGDDV